MNTTGPASSTNSQHTQIRGLSDIFASSSAFNHSSLSIKKNHTSKTLLNNCSDSICRICHGGISVDNLLKPCNCKGSLASVHLKCLERWLIESNRNYCELCDYNYRVIREPKYNYFWSIITFFQYSGQNWKYIFADLITLIVYTPTTITLTHMLMLICENLTDYQQQSFMVHFTVFAAAFVINFTYASWLVITLEKYFHLWRSWYRKNCNLKIVFSDDQIVNSTSDEC